MADTEPQGPCANITSLPNELQIQILSYLPATFLICAGVAYKRWEDIILTYPSLTVKLYDQFGLHLFLRGSGTARLVYRVSATGTTSYLLYSWFSRGRQRTSYTDISKSKFLDLEFINDSLNAGTRTLHLSCRVNKSVFSPSFKIQNSMTVGALVNVITTVALNGRVMKEGASPEPFYIRCEQFSIPMMDYPLGTSWSVIGKVKRIERLKMEGIP
ncbi:hypothetical protein H072_4876 [Dactylellina haptotyla CBS 200.50]|uniref:F-box domain-containing protein n=1 Tax=Dactylellina haptotyla (strain CBS 200.50) TaxID=1284197 RepID=S8C113_DACHA|nr:hypothetical protein H072_4876 [Dactylellina haptotyla CBS 200.50]